MPFPRMLIVRQKIPDRRIHDIPATVFQQMEEFPLFEGLQPGARIAIGVGSRGIKNIPVIVKSVAGFWKSKGFEPFIFPAMGSHGGATAEGQKAVLAALGVTESRVECPIESSMDIVETGRTPEGILTYMDRRAHESAGVFLVNRVKQHTDFEYKTESGLLKMIAIGLGKKKGASCCHRCSFGGENLGSVIQSVSGHLLSNTNILGGLAILEDGNNNTAKLVAVPAQGMQLAEEKLLDLVRTWKVGIPMELDILVVDEMGKTISGPGMDTKVVNRNIITGLDNWWKNLPWIGRLIVRSLRPDSHGNAMGIGMADVVHDRVLEAMDAEKTEINAFAAYSPRAARIPFHYSTDRKCLERVIEELTLHEDSSKARIGWIPNTLGLGVIAFSENLRTQIKENPQLEVIGAARPIPFDTQGQLPRYPFLRKTILEYAN
ncbi:MAG: hypothetical protein PHY92_04535 [Alphaproteobacteria bacterium]|nr:hypothetical protein [Alphaproteobacteria bacterium]